MEGRKLGVVPINKTEYFHSPIEYLQYKALFFGTLTTITDRKYFIYTTVVKMENNNNKDSV